MEKNRILIVEDEGIVAKDIQGVLESRGYDIPSIASSGEEAIEKAEKIRPDLILMDIRLQGNIDGVEASSQIRDALNIPIIYLTVYTDEHTLERVRKTEPFGYLQKPFKEVELCMAIQTALKTHALQQELIENQQRIKDELEEVKRLSEMDVYTETIAHELRDPLGTIKTALFNIKHKNENPAINDHIANIEKKIAESDQIINSLLDYSKENTPAFQTVSISDILDDCIADYQSTYSDWNVSVQKEYNYADNDMIDADPEHVTKIFSNILTNMFQALPNREGRITIELDHKRESGCCRIMFQDNGIGIEKESLPKIFNPFFTTKTRGIGLGLSICRQLVDLHNGKIDVSSNMGLGTKVYINLPIKQKKQPSA